MALEGLSLISLTLLSLVYIAFLQSKGLLSGLQIDGKVFTTKAEQRSTFFDLAKGVAIIAVVVIHAAALIRFLGADLPISFLEWNEYLNRAMRFAIPIFFISSGALLFLKGLDLNSLKGFYLPKVKRLFLPYAVFSFLATYAKTEGVLKLTELIGTALKDLVTGGALVPYWFIPVLFQLYLIYPLLWYLLVVKRISPPKLLFVSFFFSLFSYFLFSDHWFGLTEYLGGLTFFGPYLFFLVLGMVLKPFFFKNPKEMIGKIKAVGFSYFALAVVFTYFLTFPLQPFNDFFNVRLVYGPVIMIVILYSYLISKGSKIQRLLEKAGQESLYIYLLHFLIMAPSAEIIFKLKPQFDLNPIFIFLILSFSGLFITWGLILGIRKVFFSIYNLS